MRHGPNSPRGQPSSSCSSSVSADPWSGPAVCGRGVRAAARCAALETLGVGISCRRELCGRKSCLREELFQPRGFGLVCGGGGGLVFRVGFSWISCSARQRSLAYLARQALWWKASHRRSPRPRGETPPEGNSCQSPRFRIPSSPRNSTSSPGLQVVFYCYLRAQQL